MSERHRQIQFPSPIPFEGFEEDPERALWIPGRKKIFLPTAPKPTFSWDIETTIDRIYDTQMLSLERLYGMFADCSPGRSEYLGVSRGFRIPLSTTPAQRWSDVVRSETPLFRSRRW
jgi:hypothetical protein